ncbi:MAG: hypothetical protein DRQ42_07600, partial [Gammaproteobacteria bacterium]
VAAKKAMQRIMDAFIPKYIGAGRPLGMAIFSSTHRESNIVTLYFSPRAVSLAMQFGAIPCESTFVDQELSLLVGDERSIDFLFPEADSK